jgi:hypothetical protein
MKTSLKENSKMKKIPLVILSIVALLPMACSLTVNSPKIVTGSGVVASETRHVSGFDAIQLAGSADVTISFGDSESVIVEAEDNILPLIETVVSGGELIIKWKPMTSVADTEPVRVTVTMKSLNAASLPGSGNITIAGMNGGAVDFDLQGSGNITADGSVDSVSAKLGGSGNIVCADLQAKSAAVKLPGSGNITVFASESLDVKISGSGSVTYRGNPAEFTQSLTGSGVIQAAP